MADPTLLTVGGALATFALGLRHGLDPDHIASVDALTFRAQPERPAIAPWTGALFALGHGGAVALIAVLACLASHAWRWPAGLSVAGEWAPAVLLVGVSIANVRGLLSPGPYQAVGWKSALVPVARFGSHPASAMGVGFIFGLAFDTATQAAAWGLAAASAGPLAAAFVGLVFTAGMVVTDSLDGQLVAALLGAAPDGGALQRYRRGLGWFTVALSLLVAGYVVASHLSPAFEVSDGVFSVLGAGLVGAIALATAWLKLREKLAPTVS